MILVGDKKTLAHHEEFMIDQEKTFSLRHANRETGLNLHISTWFRYAAPGLRGEQLETIKKGGSTQTSREAIRRFFAALTERRYQIRRSEVLVVRQP